MPISIDRPQILEKKPEGTFEKIMKGLNVASSIYGIKSDMSKLEDLQKQDVIRSAKESREKDTFEMGRPAAEAAGLGAISKAEAAKSGLKEDPKGTNTLTFEVDPITKQVTYSKTKYLKPHEYSPFAGVRSEIQTDNAAAARANDIHNNEIIKQYTSRINQAQVDAETLSTPDGIVTPQIADEVTKGFANLVAGGRNSGMHESELQRIRSAQGDFAKALQYATGKPVDSLPEAQKKQLMGSISRLKEGYEDLRYAHAQRLGAGKQGLKVPEIKAALNEAIDSYKPTREQAESKVTVTDGREFLEIPASSLSDAIKDGYKQVK